MATYDLIDSQTPELTAWRRQLHRRPETAFQEQATSAFIAEKLQSFGIEVHRGLAKTGVVGKLRAGEGETAIGLRADMDALDIQEKNTFEHRSIIAGKMHACGHDGHVTMLLGAAQYLARTRRFNGVVHFIFQPAEENEGGGRVMVEEGLFTEFPTQTVFALHNWPGMPVGKFGICKGPIMASFDIFEIIVSGQSCHAAMPHLGRDPIQCAASMINALHMFVAREFNALDAAVISVTQVHGGDTWNVIPDEVVIRGTARTLSPKVRDAIEAGMKRVTDHVAAEYDCKTRFLYDRRYPTTVNSPDPVNTAIAAMSDIVGPENINAEHAPSMGAEDFAFLLNARPGAYAFIGNGESSASLHNSSYDFNDQLLPIGASYFARLVEKVLA